MNSDQMTDLAAKISEAGEYRILEIVSSKGKLLALMLRGGRKASPNVDQPLRLAKEMAVWLEGVRDFWLNSQRAPESEREAPPPLAEDIDLPILLSAIGRDAQYLKRLTQGGIGMSPNAVEPRRVLAELITKLEAVQARWPDLQGPNAIEPMPVRRPRGSRIVDEMIASGELKLTRDPIVSAERRGGVRQYSNH